METAIAFIIVLGVLIFVHELGHFLVAKFAGVGVVKFSLGFGPKLIGKKVGETEYLISALPLGGYVKMVGESLEDEVPEGMEEKSFSNKRPLTKILIVLAGPAFNIVFAILLLSSLWVYGVPTLTTKIGDVKEGMPAYEAGIKKGDVVVSIMGHPVSKWEELSKFIKESDGPIRMELERDNTVYSVTVEPRVTEIKNVFGEEESVRVIGISASGETIIIRYNPLTALVKGTVQGFRIVGLTALSIKKLFEGKVPLETVGGPILIAQLAGEQAKHGARNFIFFIALLGINLGVINLLPIPILDGGHIVFFVVELIRKKPVSEKGVLVAQKIGIAILVLIMALAFYNDILRLIGRQ